MFLKQVFAWFELDRKWGFNLIQTRSKAKRSTDAVICHCKIIICTNFRPKKPKISRGKFLDNHLKKIMEKLRQLRKSCNHKRNISGIYNEKLHYHCLQQLPTLRFKTWDLRKWGNSGERKWKAQTRALYPVFSLKSRFCSYLVENSQKKR